MPITNDTLDWDSDDVVLWRAFLATRTGGRLLPKLVEFAPPLLEKGESNELFVRSGKVLGFQEAVKTLLSLAVIQPQLPQAVSSYPSLDDDSQWDA